jgi:formylglycine-generating enzyme required for sulfatase activity
VSARPLRAEVKTTDLLHGAGFFGFPAGAGTAPVAAPPATGRPVPVRPPRAPDRTPPRLYDLVEVPAGTYVLGERNEEREVAFAGVRIGRFPVVNAHMSAFVRDTGRPVGPALAVRLDEPQLADHPATEVTFEDALAFCAWAGVRLPTGDEWEAAARGPRAHPWPWGGSFDAERCACAEAAFGWTVPVRAHPHGAAPCGAEQLAGNVWEWVGDPPDEDGWRAVRGGSHLDHAWGVRAARVLAADPARATATTGLRIATDITDRPRREP